MPQDYGEAALWFVHPLGLAQILRVNTCDLGRIIRNHRMTRTENPPRERGIMSTVWHTFPAWQGKHPSGCASPRTHESAEALSEKQAKPCRPGSIEPLKEHGRNLLPPPSPHDRPEHAENTNGSRLATAAGMTEEKIEAFPTHAGHGLFRGPVARMPARQMPQGAEVQGRAARHVYPLRLSRLLLVGRGGAVRRGERARGESDRSITEWIPGSSPGMTKVESRAACSVTPVAMQTGVH